MTLHDADWLPSSLFEGLNNQHRQLLIQFLILRIQGTHRDNHLIAIFDARCAKIEEVTEVPGDHKG